MKKALILFSIFMSVNASALSVERSQKTLIRHGKGFYFTCKKQKQLKKYSIAAHEVLNKYKKDFIEKNIKKVVLCKKITFGLVDQYYPVGLYDPWSKIIYVKAENPKYFRDTLHHEVSSFILRDYCKKTQDDCKAFKAKWTRFNKAPYDKNWRKIPKDIYYWWNRGFISKYAMSNFENDFNTTVEFIITDRYRKKFIEKRHVFHDAHVQKFGMVDSMYKKYLTKNFYEKFQEWK